METPSLYLAPIQGITDFTFRNLYDKHFNGILKYYTPFIRFFNTGIKKSSLTDLNPQNNNPQKTVPQILSNKADELIYFAKLMHDYGYKEINWNLGCPYSMVTNRQLGSGLLPYPDKIHSILESVIGQIPLDLSIKMRLGHSHNDEIFSVLSIFNKFKIAEIIIHPRIGIQQYKGNVNTGMFVKCLNLYDYTYCFNGDIRTYTDFLEINSIMPQVKSYMIGRGAVSNPFLIEKLSGNNESSYSVKLERFSLFHHELYEQYARLLSGPGHLLAKMQHLWEYFSKSFNNPHKVNKMVKKSNKTYKFELAIYQIFNDFEYIA